MDLLYLLCPPQEMFNIFSYPIKEILTGREILTSLKYKFLKHCFFCSKKLIPEFYMFLCVMFKNLVINFLNQVFSFEIWFLNFKPGF